MSVTSFRCFILPTKVTGLPSPTDSAWERSKTAELRAVNSTGLDGVGFFKTGASMDGPEVRGKWFLVGRLAILASPSHDPLVIRDACEHARRRGACARYAERITHCQ